jgi:cytochrome c oxidase cbb3-type subunit III
MNLLFVVAPLVLCTLAWAEESPDIAEGKALFRSNCAFCHGLTGGGGRGPALNSGRLLHGSSEEDIRKVVRNGVAGTNMPAFEMEKDELDQLVRFVRQLSAGQASSQPVPGDPVKGQAVYARSGCASCHRIGNSGSVFGPELTRIGAGRSSSYIRESVLNPSADIAEDYEGVTVVTRGGKRISGVRLNEDTFSVQLRDASQKIHMFQKDELREVIHEKNSWMPSYSSLNQKDLMNLLAYLDSLRGDLNAGAEARKAEGIR